MTVPDAVNSASVPSAAVAPSLTVVVATCASAICEATVRFQMRSYSANSSALSSPETSPGVRKTSPAGRMASWASCAFFTLLA